MKTLGALLYPDFEMLDLYGPLEMFGALRDQVRIVTVAQSAGPVKASQGPSTLAEFSFENVPALDYILVPGGLGTIPELENEALLDFLRTHAPGADVVMSVCTGSALLAKASLLDGRRATTNKQFFDLARDQGPNTEWAEAARWVEDYPYVTSSGVSAGTDMALAVIAQQFGAEAAETVAVYTEYQWHRDAETDPFVAHLNEGTALLAQQG